MTSLQLLFAQIRVRFFTSLNAVILIADSNSNFFKPLIVFPSTLATYMYLVDWPSLV